MFRLWAKEWKDGRLLRDVVVEEPGRDTRTHKVFRALEQACLQLDLAQPIWLKPAVRDFQKGAKCRFTKDAFVETIEFDYLEIQVIEEDEEDWA
ncbi:MAG: hypothetical protein Q4C60_02020 [Eubacteriales bacterium]|nr:hypothetical protein [Eubacteriales bacterium]